MINRRKFLLAGGAGLLSGSALSALADKAPSLSGSAMTAISGKALTASRELTPAGYRPVTTLNGRSLPYRMRDGVKEFHLIAEEVEHEFAPGTRIKAWGYNGSAPGPTLEAVEGDRVRIYVTNKLKEATSVHWHGLILPSGMDGVGGLSHPPIGPGETFVYEFTLKQHGTHMYHPHADEMVQLALGMMGMFIIHPRQPLEPEVHRDYAILLHNWAVHPGTWRPDPSVMQDFNLWTINGKVFPAVDHMLAQTGERVRIRVGNLSMWNHPIHLHGVQFAVTGSDGGRWPESAWRTEVSEIVGVGQARDIEFTGVPGDWAFHCHMSHHTMNPMGHSIPNPIGVDQSGDAQEQLQRIVPGFMAMGEHGMAEHQKHVQMGHMKGPDNTLPMMAGVGPFGNLEMGGMFTVMKVRDKLVPGEAPGWYQNPEGEVAWRVDTVPEGLPR